MLNLPTLPRPAYRLGILVPPANPAVEIEYPALASSEIALHTMRLPVIAGDLAARNQGYIDSYAPALAGFGTLKLDAVAIAMTGPQYRLLYQGDVALCQRLSAQCGIPVETASMSIAKALQALNIEHISLVSPYPNWLTTLAVAYWESAGFKVHHVSTFADDLVAYRVSCAEIVQTVNATPYHPQGAIVLSGTGMRTLEAMAQTTATADATRVPVLSSNLCSVWSLSQHLRTATAAPWLRHSLPSPLRTTLTTLTQA